ncbi:MAG: Na+/H+ antiporter subunit E [Pseudomonadota bacterium]
MGYFLGLLIVITGLWLGLSGLYKTLILSFMVVSIILTMILAVRLKVIDREGVPYGRLLHLLVYWVWLVIEIFKANWQVIKAILSVDTTINPALVKLKTQRESDLAKTVFANSITLTPGTVTVAVESGSMLVHALNEENAGPGAFDEMDKRSKLATDGKDKPS